MAKGEVHGRDMISLKNETMVIILKPIFLKQIFTLWLELYFFVREYPKSKSLKGLIVYKSKHQADFESYIEDKVKVFTLDLIFPIVKPVPLIRRKELI